MWNLLNKEPSYQKYTTNPIDAFLTSKSRAPSSFLWSVLPSQPQPAALQSADQMTKQKPQAVLWRFVAQSTGHKASWQIQKNRQLFRSNVERGKVVCLFVCLFVLTTPGMPVVALLPQRRPSQGTAQSNPGLRVRQLGAAFPLVLPGRSAWLWLTWSQFAGRSTPGGKLVLIMNSTHF